MTIQSLKQSIIFLIICWLIFLFGIGTVSQISLRNVALHFRKYQATLSMLLLTLGDFVVTIFGSICHSFSFPTNNNRAIDELIIVIIIYLIPMWISFFITFFADFEKDPVDNTEVQELTFGEYVKELKQFSKNYCLQLSKYYEPVELRNISWLACPLFALFFDLDFFTFTNSVRIINFLGAFFSLLTILFTLIMDDPFNKLQIIFLIQYCLICGFYSIILGKTLRIFSPAKMMEVTGFIGLAPALAKIFRMCFEEFFGFLINNNTINRKIQEKCDKIDISYSYVRFGAWLYYIIKYSGIFYFVFGLLSIVINFYAIYYIQFVPEIEVPFDKASIEELEQKPETVISSTFQFIDEKKEDDE